NNRIDVQIIGELLEAVLRALPGTEDQVLRRTVELLEPGEALTVEELRALVDEQLEQLYEAGLIVERSVGEAAAAAKRATAATAAKRATAATANVG
ncbi:MAG: hypothetical protein MI919_27680, partial [Holophagales bacterium]|nr:hypothetical protein [Holophagales bacterium]